MEIDITPVLKKFDELREQLGTDDAVGRHLKVDPSYITNVRSGRRLPGPRILKALHIEKVITFVEIKE